VNRIAKRRLAAQKQVDPPDLLFIFSLPAVILRVVVYTSATRLERFMSLKEQLRADLKESMRSGDAERRTVIRGIMAAVKEAELRKRETLVREALRKHGTEHEDAIGAIIESENIEQRSELDDAEIQAIVQKLVKQRQDSIADARQADRPDIAEAEQAEITILEGYLPRQLSREEIEAAVRAAIERAGASGMKDMGRVMGPLMDELKGRADGKVVSEVVREQLSS
jgi:uncharacterized protein YqeY